MIKKTNWFNFFSSISISVKLSVIFTALAVMMTISYFILWSGTDRGKDGPDAVNLVSDQSHLVLELGFYSGLLVRHGGPLEDTIFHIIQGINKAMYTIKYGDPEFNNQDQEVELKAVLSKEIAPLYVSAEKLWEQIKSNAGILLEVQADIEKKQQALSVVEKNALELSNNLQVLFKAGLSRPSFWQRFNFGAFLIFLSGLGVIFLAYFLVQLIVLKPLKVTSAFVTNLSDGVLYNSIEYNGDDEIGQTLKDLKKIDTNLANASGFALCISQGDLDTQYETQGDQDILGKSLLAMRDNLKNVIEETHEALRQAGTNGNLDVRIELDDKEGAWQELCLVINNLLTTLSQPVKKINKVINAMSDGDLTVYYTEESRGDISSLASNLNQALNNLNRLLKRIQDGANTIEESSSEMLASSNEMSSSTNEIATSISEMSSGAHTQVVKVDESSTLIESILRAAREMGERSETINQAAKKGVENSERGSKMVKNVVESISSISQYSAKTTTSMKVLSGRSNEIARVLNVITDIAAQTNLLALNAAIEAAQAGDAGRGFGVVAEEIRKLAENSKQSANEIESLILAVQNDTKEASEVIDTMNATVKESVDASNEAAMVFSEMAASSKQTLSFSEEIVESSKRQVESISNVVSITESVVVIAEQTAAGTEEMASSAAELSTGMNNYKSKSESLNHIAINLKEEVGRFKLRAVEVA